MTFKNIFTSSLTLSQTKIFEYLIAEGYSLIFEKKKKSSILKGQRPIRHREEARPLIWTRLAYWITIAAVVWLGAVSLKGFVVPKIASAFRSFEARSQPFEFEIEAKDLSSEREQSIRSYLMKNIISGSRYELTQTSQNIGQIFPVKAISLIRSTQNRIVVQITSHLPVVRILEIPGSLATKEGLVYVDPETSEKSSTLPILSGAVEPRLKIERRRDSEVFISETERQGIIESASLVEALLHKSIPVVSLNWNNYRGLSFELDSETTVVIGLSPYDAKVREIHKMVIDGTIKEFKHLELDFNGKIFAKRKV